MALLYRICIANHLHLSFLQAYIPDNNFAVSTISSFKPNFECKRPYLNIVRGILRQQNYMIEGKDSLEKYGNGVFKRTIIYTISRNI